MNPDVITKIKMLNGSMRCFTFGVLGLLPVIGVPFALTAIWIGDSAKAKEKLFWNAAKPYRVWGEVCSMIGLLLSIGILFVITVSWAFQI